MPFKVQVDETGFNTREAFSLAKELSPSSKQREHMSDMEALIALFQVGPKTGDTTFSDDWADGLLGQVMARCPSGRMTGLSVVRESMDYPVVSGEIVTLRGYCIQ